MPWVALVVAPAAMVALGMVVFGLALIASKKRKFLKDFGPRFLFIGNLGRGSFGHVHKVIYRKDGGTYALKIFELSSKKIAFRFITKEIDIMKSLVHPNIIKYVKAYQSSSSQNGAVQRVAILMQFCGGGDLWHYIRNRRGLKLPFDRVKMWLKELSSAVSYMHSRSVMHRDLKPENILLNEHSSLMLADFGLARMLTSGYAGSLKGTKNFIAPEAFHGRYDNKADVFSLGCVFVCLVVPDVVPKRFNGKRHRIPNVYGENVISIIEQCLTTDKFSRPTAQDLHTLICNL